MAGIGILLCLGMTFSTVFLGVSANFSCLTALGCWGLLGCLGVCAVLVGGGAVVGRALGGSAEIFAFLAVAAWLIFSLVSNSPR